MAQVVFAMGGRRSGRGGVCIGRSARTPLHALAGMATHTLLIVFVMLVKPGLF
jgi:hypothetical protein